jgi:hypothetical protein
MLFLELKKRAAAKMMRILKRLKKIRNSRFSKELGEMM